MAICGPCWHCIGGGLALRQRVRLLLSLATLRFTRFNRRPRQHRLFSSAVSREAFIDEAHLSTQCSQAGQEARVSGTHVDPCRSQYCQGSPPPRKEIAVRLIWRVQERSTFDALRTTGQIARGRAMWIRRIDNPRNRVELAFAVGRRYGTAVERNLMRRRLRSIATALVKSGDLPDGVYLIGVNQQAKSMKFNALSNQLGSLIEELTNMAASRVSQGVPHG